MVYKVIVEANDLERLKVVNFGRIYHFHGFNRIATIIDFSPLHVVEEQANCHLVMGRVSRI